MFPGPQHHLGERTDKSCLLSFSVCLITFPLIPCGLVCQNPRLKSWVYQQQGCHAGCWAGPGHICLGWLDILCQQHKCHPLSSPCARVQGLSLRPRGTRAAASLTLGELRIGTEIREGISQAEQPLIRSARGQTMQNCGEKTKKERHILSAQCGSITSHLSG